MSGGEGHRIDLERPSPCPAPPRHRWAGEREGWVPDWLPGRKLAMGNVFPSTARNKSPGLSRQSPGV